MAPTPRRGIAAERAVKVGGLLLLLVAAATLRLVGMAFDQPYVYYPDEFAVAKPAMGVVATGNLIPRLDAYPAFLIYAETAVVAAVHTANGDSLDTSIAPGYGGLAGSSQSDFTTAQYPYVLGGRLVVGALSVLTVLLLALAGLYWKPRRRGEATEATGAPVDAAVAPAVEPTAEPTAEPASSRPDYAWVAGLVAGAFYALAILPLDYARYLVTDVPSALFAAAVALTALAAVSRPADRRSDVYLILSGLLVGVAASSKYNAAALALVPAVAYLIRAGSVRELPGFALRAVRSRIPYVVALAAVVGFVVVTPGIIFDARNVLHGLRDVILHYNVNGDPGNEGDSFGYYVNYLWSTGFGPVLSVLTLAGAAWALVRHRASDLVLVSFGLVYFVLVSIPRVHFERDLLPMVPFAALLAGRFVADAVAALDAALRSRPLPVRRAATAAILIALLLQPTAAAVADAHRASLPRTETAALQWVDGHMAAGTAIVREEYTPQLDASRYHVGFSWTLSYNSLSWYRAHGFRYAIASSRVNARYTAEAFPAENSFYEGLFALPRVFEVEPSGSMAGPTIVILDLGT